MTVISQDLRKCHNWWLVRDATSLMTTFKYYRQSHTLQKKYASCVSPISFSPSSSSSPPTPSSPSSPSSPPLPHSQRPTQACKMMYFISRLISEV
ncbi:MAG TPA: hypothetical protein V6D25_02380 [Leptolyngbyaceae cyanobacterium]